MNGMASKTPGLVVRAHTHDDVLHAMDFARSNNVHFALRNTGHGYNGQSSTQGGLLLDVSGLATITVDAQAGLLTCGGGATWGPVYEAANRAGFIVVGGHDPTVGVVGCTLGGCHGEFSRQYGLSADNVVEMQVALFEDEARVVTVNNETNRELFWAMLGGGPGFGVVLTMTMRMHAAPPAIHAFSAVLEWPPTHFHPLCPGLDTAKNKSQWWSENGTSVLKKVIFNASWWASLPEGWSAYGTQCSMTFHYTGSNLEEDLKAPAILALKELMGLGSSFQKLLTLPNQSMVHMVEADAVNYEYQYAFTSFVPADAELGDVADVLVKAFTDGEISDVAFNYVLGGKIRDLDGNAIGDVVREAAGFEMTVDGCQMEACQTRRAALLEIGEMDEVDLISFETLQATADKLGAVARGKYINEWNSKAGYVFPSPSNFWDSQTYTKLLGIKQAVDPCNVMTVEAGVAWDLPHCKQAQYRHRHVLV